MRVGRITPIKVMRYKDVRTLLRYFSIKGVASESGSMNNVSKLMELQPDDSKNITKKIQAQKALNNMVVDTTEANELAKMERKTGLLAEKSKIRIMKDMKKAREGSKISTLEMLLKATGKNFQTVDGVEDTTDDIMQDTPKVADKSNYSQVEKNKSDEDVKDKVIDKKDKKDTIDTKEDDNKVNYLEEYEKMLKELKEKKDKEKERKDQNQIAL